MALRINPDHRMRHFTVMRDCLELIRQQGKPVPDLDHIPLDDSATFKLLQAGDTLGVYHLESVGLLRLIRSAKPVTLSELLPIVALFRPGTLDSGAADRFIVRKRSGKRNYYKLPGLNLILKETYGVIVFFEQISRILALIGGFDEQKIRDYVSSMKHRDNPKTTHYREELLEKALTNKLPKSQALKLVDEIEQHGPFPISKAKCIANYRIGYKMLFLKAHYLLEYLAAWITNTFDDRDQLKGFIHECHRKKIQLVLPDINQSDKGCTVHNGKIHLGFNILRAANDTILEAILSERRANGNFASLHDFCNRLSFGDISRQLLSDLICGGAFDYTGLTRSQMSAIIEKMKIPDKPAKAGNAILKESKATISASTPRSCGGLSPIPMVDEWEDLTKIMKQRDAVGVDINCHPIDCLQDKLKGLVNVDTLSLIDQPIESTLCMAGLIEEVKTYRTKAGKRIAFCTLEDRYGSTEIVVFPNLYDPQLLVNDRPVVIRGHFEKAFYPDQKKILVDEIKALDFLDIKNKG
jgi:DNA polymerase-3 subunit alpha